MSPSIVVVGAGPSGFYAVDGLTRALPECRVDVVDRLPTPFGLVRFGVAPDHQGTKGVARQFDRLLTKPSIRFLGGVELGRDVSLDELRDLYDAVVIAIGCHRDRRLGIPGEDLAGVFGSAAFTAWFNGHPDFAALAPPLADARSVAVIGNGNVAIDVARVLAKTADEMAKSDIAPTAAAAIAAAALRDIGIHGRRGPAESSFTNNELAELGRLRDWTPVVAADALGGIDAPESDPAPERMRKRKNLEILRGFATDD
ncbi:MAG: FAD-dependent oxidoreductase, partial [Rhodospirillales bacterium]|nr:FAD-dependent oxidoreductase [Rhodospirillales bacterium]